MFSSAPAQLSVSAAAPCLFGENLQLLRPGIQLISSLAAKAYATKDPRCLDSSIGGHVRHCIEFYRCFLTGLDSGCMDYDARPRDPALETDPAAACQALTQISHDLAQAADLHDTGQPLQIIENHDGGPPAWSASSVGRELRALISHTVHHCALIAILLKLQGLPVPDGFGIAPSTQRHRARIQPGA
jgi:hypothetical protein